MEENKHFEILQAYKLDVTSLSSVKSVKCMYETGLSCSEGSEERRTDRRHKEYRCWNL